MTNYAAAEISTTLCRCQSEQPTATCHRRRTQILTPETLINVTMTKAGPRPALNGVAGIRGICQKVDLYDRGGIRGKTNGLHDTVQEPLQHRLESDSQKKYSWIV